MREGVRGREKAASFLKRGAFSLPRKRLSHTKAKTAFELPEAIAKAEEKFSERGISAWRTGSGDVHPADRISYVP